jgi:molybdate transport system substrate-binding protein
MSAPSIASVRHIASRRIGSWGRLAILVGAIAPGVLLNGPDPRAQSATVAAAADLKFALDEISSKFTAERHERVDIVFGSSGLLSRQIREGAPFEMFLSADEQFVNDLADAGLTRDRGALYAMGRVVLYAPKGSPLVPDPELNGLRTLVQKGAVTKFAIANPAYAPYGRAAEAVLRKRGLWDALQPALVLGDNVAQAAQFASAGSTVGGIIAHSLVLTPPLRDAGRYALIPEADHPPLRQRMVLLKRVSPVTEHFYEYLQTSGAREIFRRFGFALPGS